MKIPIDQLKKVVHAVGRFGDSLIGLASPSKQFEISNIIGVEHPNNFNSIVVKHLDLPRVIIAFNLTWGYI